MKPKQIMTLEKMGYNNGESDGIKIILAEKMTGHSVKSIPMADIYNLPTIEVLFKEYKKAIP